MDEADKIIERIDASALGYSRRYSSAAAAGVKHDSAKPRMDLLSGEAIEKLSMVLSHGAQKYSERNWEAGIKYSRILGAILRHVFAYLRGERVDPETGLSHIAHAMAGCMFILHYEENNKDMDDLPRGATE